MAKTLDVKALRNRLRLSRKEFAKRVDVDVSTVCRWENGKTPRGAALTLLRQINDETRAPKRAHEVHLADAAE